MEPLPRPVTGPRAKVVLEAIRTMVAVLTELPPVAEW